jgi:hypothetical protein
MFGPKKIYMKRLLPFLFLAAVGLWACKDGGGVDLTPTPKTLCDSATFNAMVLPIFTKNCNLSGCHSSGAGGIDLRKYTTSKACGESGLLLPAIKQTVGGQKNMPQGAAKLSDRDIAIIECWITKGYPEN